MGFFEEGNGLAVGLNEKRMDGLMLINSWAGLGLYSLRNRLIMSTHYAITVDGARISLSSLSPKGRALWVDPTQCRGQGQD